MPGPEEGSRKTCGVFSKHLTLPHPSEEVVSVSKKAILSFPFKLAVGHGATYTCQEVYLTAYANASCPNGLPFSYVLFTASLLELC